MGKLSVWIKYLIVISFFTPFVTCNKLGYSEAVSYSKSPTDSSAQPTADTLKYEEGIPVENSNTNLAPDKKSFWDKVWYKIIYPTEESISGIGCILVFANVIWPVLIGSAFLISLFLIFPWKFLKKRKIKLLLAAIVFLCIFMFIINVFLENKTELKWGAWLMLTLTFIQVLLLYLQKAKTNDKFS